LEIGPGLGPLTEHLLARAGEVIAVEKDARLVTILRERFAAEPKLRLIHDDAVDFLARGERDWSTWKLVANLPYSVASVMLVELATGPTCPERLVVTLQHEVARRLMVGPGTKDYGVLTLLVQQRYEPVTSFEIPPGCFFPPPDVASTCVALQRRAVEGLTDLERHTFGRLVKAAFAERRKMTLKLLKRVWPVETLRDAFASLGISETCRAETLSLAQFAALARRLTKPAQAAEEMFDVVNERDEVVGRERRSEVHRQGLRHRAVHVLVFNRRGKLFLQKRSRWKDSFPGTWDSSASGHLAPGETYDDCAVREVKEELGLTLAGPPERLFKLEAGAATGQEFVWVYRCEAEGPFVLPPEEIETGGWFTPEQITAWLAECPQDFAAALPLIWGQYCGLGVLPASPR
jgi:16S rRNA (adenine1518-N6/adenine1519-N6)-dimethyltransferase